jgi:glutamate---cysteine ligase / carboxylate-amine ligase
MIRESFHQNAWPTLGVELELGLVDTESMELKSAFTEVYSSVPEPVRDSVKPEFMQCYIELNTRVCPTVDDVRADLAPKIRAVEHAAALNGISLLWAGTHPFARWQDQKITAEERYLELAERLQETVVRPVTFGLHIHVGVESGDKAIAIGDRLQRYLPILLALSANSPFWHGRLTGHHAHRVEVLEGFPTGGIPPRMRSWDEYVGLVTQMQEAEFVGSERDLWWDVRPNADNGTVEIRICDMPANLSSVLGLSALSQCLVQYLSLGLDQSIEEPESHPLILRQNRWRAYRYGLDAQLVGPACAKVVSARKLVQRVVDRLRSVSEALGCTRQLELVTKMASQPTGAERQIALFAQTGDLVEVVRRMCHASTIAKADAAHVVHGTAHATGGLSGLYRSSLQGEFSVG